MTQQTTTVWRADRFHDNDGIRIYENNDEVARISDIGADRYWDKRTAGEK